MEVSAVIWFMFYSFRASVFHTMCGVMTPRHAGPAAVCVSGNVRRGDGVSESL